MRKLFGSVVFLGGLGGLGWYGMAETAAGIQSHVSAQAQGVAEGALHDIEVDVSGRDISVRGIADTQAELTALRAAFDGIEGRRVVDLSDVSILTYADPFEIIATVDTDGRRTLVGAVPSEAARSVFGAQDLADDLVWSAGVPDAQWIVVAQRGYATLDHLMLGEARLTDRTLSVSGLVATPSVAAQIEASLADLPEAYDLQTRFEEADDGTPLRLAVSVADGVVTGAGKFPSNLPLSDIADRFDATVNLSVIQSVFPADDPAWPEMARTSIRALEALKEGQLEVTDNAISLTGVADPEGRDTARALLDGLEDQFDVTVDIRMYDDGRPFEVRAYFDGLGAQVEGKLPADFELTFADGLDLEDLTEVAFITDPDGRFAVNAAAGLQALALLQDGELVANAARIEISGVAVSPADDAQIEAALAGAAPDTIVIMQRRYLDDGTPPAWQLEYSATKGGSVTGKLPADLNLETLAATLGLPVLLGDAGQSIGILEDSSVETLAMVGDYLPEVEAMTFETSPAGPALNLVLSPSVNVDLVAMDLAARLPVDVAFSIRSLEALPVTGATRVNQATQNRERFVYGNWLPIQTFAPILPICRDRSEAVLAAEGIGFLSASARLDGKSIRAINTLSSIVQRCVGDGGLVLEISGHTDATGSEIANQLLSENRANAVRAALIERGVDEDSLRAVGYGQTRPIGDNSTEAGRAANRRTEFLWSE